MKMCRLCRRRLRKRGSKNAVCGATCVSIGRLSNRPAAVTDRRAGCQPVANPPRDSIRFPTCSRSTIEPATVRNLWQQFRAFLARRIRYKITGGGVLFTFAIVLVAFGAAVSANNLIFLILAAMMATLLVSGLVSRLCLAGLATEDGTGIVHLAPAFGEDDYRVAAGAPQIPFDPTRAGTLYNPVEPDGTYDQRVRSRTGG